MQLLFILLGTTITSYILFPLIFAYPSNNGIEAVSRNKRDIFEDIVKVGRAVSDKIIPDGTLEHTFDINSFYVKDLERLCRRLRGSPQRYDILCLENWGKTIVNIGNVFEKQDDVLVVRPKRTPTPKRWPTIDIDVIFVKPTSTTPIPTTTPEPFDWPLFVRNITNDAKGDIAKFGSDIREEMHNLLDRLDNSNISKSLRKTADEVENVGGGIEDLNTGIADVVKSFDGAESEIHEVGTSIHESIDNAGIAIADHLESGLTMIETSIVTSADSIETAINARGSGIQESIDSGLESIKDAIPPTVLPPDLSTVEERLEEIRTSIDNAANISQTAVGEAAGTIKMTLEGAAKGVETSLDDVLTGVESAIQTGSDHIAEAIEHHQNITLKTRHIAKMINAEKSLAKISQILDLISQLLEKEPSESGEALDDLPTKMMNAIDESQISKHLMEILKNIRKNTNVDLTHKRNLLAMHVHRLAAGMLFNKNSKAAGLKINDIANKLGKIEMNDEDVLQNLGLQIEELGRALKKNDEVFPGIRTGQLFESIGTVLKTLPN